MYTSPATIATSLLFLLRARLICRDTSSPHLPRPIPVDAPCQSTDYPPVALVSFAAMPNNTSSPVKRPGLGRRAVSSHAVVTRANSNLDLSESHNSKAPIQKAHRAHVVGGGRNHHRNPSIGKNFNKLQRFQLGPEPTGRHHQRKKSAPATPVASPKGTAHVRWEIGTVDVHPKNDSMKRNNSTPILRRNNSAVGKKTLVTDRPVLSSGKKKSVGFELGDDETDEAEWEDTTQSPESTRRNSVAPSNHSAENPAVLVDPLTFVKRPYPQVPRATSLPDSVINKFVRRDLEEDEDEDEDEESGKQTAKPTLDAPSNQTEVQKGIAIQQQRKIYDGLLNMRIRLQKAIVAANTFSALDPDSSSETEAYEAAEEAAIKLLNTISDLRENLAPPTAAGSKRKRALDIDFSNQQIWKQIQEDDQRSMKFREDRLDKWSRKVQSVTVAAPASRLGAKPKTLISALQDQLANPDGRLVKRTRVPRSCAPVQASKKITESEDIYDDADFYQLLLKELVDQRTVESAAEQSSAVASVMLTANKEAKTRKVVDRKASKGRKLRFTVHEKLQNFMAPEDRRGWEQGAIDRFFGTLFGQKMELNEEESDDDEMEALYKQDEGLRLFR